MAGRDVTLKIKVDDSDVPKAEASLKRLNNAANGNGNGSSNNVLTQQEKLARFMQSDLPQAATKAEQAMSAVETATAGAGEAGTAAAASFGPLGLAIGVVAVAAAAGAIVIVALAGKILELSKATADHAIEAGNMAEQQGLQLSTSIALRNELEAQGRTYLNLDGAVDNFRKTIGEAAAGSVDAKNKLKELGLDGAKAINNVDGAFKQAVKSIAEAPSVIEQVRRATAAFGDDGVKLLPFFREFNGNVDAVIKKAQEMGIQLSGKNVDDARAFNRAYDEVAKTIQALKNEFGKEFLNAVRDALRSFGQWLRENKDDIFAWAKWAGDWIQYAIDKWRAFQKERENAAKWAPQTGDPWNQQQPQWQQQVPTQPQSYGITPGPNLAGPDPQALAAAQEAARKLAEERAKAAKAELSAQIQLYENSAGQLGKAFDDAFSKITDGFKETLDENQYQANWDALKQWYGEQINELAPNWEKLVEAQITAEKKGNAETELARRELQEKLQALGKKTLDHDDSVNKAINDNRKRSDANAFAEAQEMVRKSIQLDDQRLQHYVENQRYLLDHGKITERQYLDFIHKAEVDNLEQQKSRLEELLSAAGNNGKKRAEIEGAIAVLNEEISQAKLRGIRAETAAEASRAAVLKEIGEIERSNGDAELTRLRRIDAANAEKLDLMRQIQQLSDAIANGGQNDALEIEAAHLQDILDMRHREVDAVIAVNRAQLELSHQLDISNNQIRAGVYEHIAQQRTMSEAIADGINKTYDSLTALVNGPLDKLDRKTKGLLSFIIEPIKAFQNIQTGKIFTGLVDAIFPGLGSEMEKAKNPVVGELKDHTKLLQQIVQNTGGGGIGIPGVGSLPGIGGGSGGGFFSSILGSFGIGGNGPGGTPNFNPNSGGSSSGGGFGGFLRGILGDRTGQVGADGNVIVDGRSGFKKFLSSPLSGLLLGGGIGLAISLIGKLIGRNSLRRKEEGIRNQGILDAQDAIRRQFDSLEEDVRFGRVDSASAVTQGASIGEQIRAQYLQMANSLTDKKTRNHALQDVSRIDSLIAQKMAELRGLSDVASASAERAKRILPEFAGGTFISSAFRDFQRVNGMLSGSWTGRDYRAALLADAEMVLNPSQQSRVRAAAGFDVFAGAGIPNYPGTVPAGSMAGGGIVGGGSSAGAMQQTVVVNPTIFIEGVAMDDRIEAYTVSDRGERTQIKVIKKLKKSGDI